MGVITKHPGPDLPPGRRSRSNARLEDILLHFTEWRFDWFDVRPWLGSFATFNIALRTTTAVWVQARVLALYLATIVARAC